LRVIAQLQDGRRHCGWILNWEHKLFMPSTNGKDFHVGTTEEFAGKTALIAGATSGIGAAAAGAFARRGAHVIVGRDKVRGHDVVRYCAGLDGKALFFRADVTRPGDVAAMLDFAIESLGRVDIAFNNAGFQEPRALLAEQPDDMYDQTFDTNVRSVFHSMKSEIGVMLKQGDGGTIIKNASVSGVALLRAQGHSAVTYTVRRTRLWILLITVVLGPAASILVLANGRRRLPVGANQEIENIETISISRRSCSCIRGPTKARGRQLHAAG
jgi:hypothetical protein